MNPASFGPGVIVVMVVVLVDVCDHEEIESGSARIILAQRPRTLMWVRYCIFLVFLMV